MLRANQFIWSIWVLCRLSWKYRYCVGAGWSACQCCRDSWLLPRPRPAAAAGPMDSDLPGSSCLAGRHGSAHGLGSGRFNLPPEATTRTPSEAVGGRAAAAPAEALSASVQYQLSVNSSTLRCLCASICASFNFALVSTLRCPPPGANKLPRLIPNRRFHSFSSPVPFVTHGALPVACGVRRGTGPALGRPGLLSESPIRAADPGRRSGQVFCLAAFTGSLATAARTT